MNEIKPRRRRIFPWIFLVVQALFLIWIVSGITATSDNCAGQTGQQLEACEAGTAVGGGVAVLLIVFLWLATDVILGVGYLIFRRRS